MRRRLAGGSALLAVFALAAPAAAEQFVVARATYTHSAQTTKDSHYLVAPGPDTPDDWTAPVDYANGSVHVRLEVKTKPSDTPTRYQICFEMKQNYCCTAQAPAYTSTGVYEWDTKVENLWRPGPVDFAQGIVRNALILKDTNNVKPAPENVGEETSQLYFPSDLDVTVTVVSAGSELVPPDEPAPMGGSGGGGSGGAGGMNAGGVSAGGLGGGSAGEPAGGGAGAASGGMPAVTPDPNAGTSTLLPMMPSAGSAGSTSMTFDTSNGAEDGGCNFGAQPSSGYATLLALLGVTAASRLRRRAPAQPQSDRA